MRIPDNADDLVKLAINTGDVYIAAAVHKVATRNDRKQLESLMFGKRRNALMLARWEHTPESVLQALSSSTDRAVVLRLDKNPNTPSHAMSNLYAEEQDGFKRTLSLTMLIAQHQHTPISILECIAKFDNDIESLMAVSRNPSANADVLRVLMGRLATSHKFGLVKKNVAANPSATSDLLEDIYSESDSYTRAAVISHVNCPQSLIGQAINDDDVLVMRKLAADKRLTTDVLARLVLSKDKAVRCSVASNLALTKVLIKHLVLDNSNAVRREVAARADLTVANIKCLMSDSDHWVRMWLARNPIVPRKVLERLSLDQHADVRRAVARNPRCPIRLLNILAKDANSWVQSAVAYQHQSPKRLMVALAEVTDVDVLSGVANNPHTPQRVLQKLTTSIEADIRRGVILNQKASRNTLLPLLEDPYYLHRVMLVANSKLKDKDKWILHNDPDFQVRFVVFKWLVNRLNKVIVQ
jgi:hypothetical protein